MSRIFRLGRCTEGAAAVEMALALPLLLVLLFGSAEIGNYFLDEHILVKAVRDGARYAARQDFSNFSTCSGTPGGTVDADTKNVVMTGVLSGGTNRLPFWTTRTITVSTSCSTTAGTTTLGGIYNNNKNAGGTLIGAPIVTVSATVPYTPILKAYGFTGVGYNLNATQKAAVMGI
jgi:Flp pilus assembly protein TadG